jgi:hypothetical protein
MAVLGTVHPEYRGGDGVPRVGATSFDTLRDWDGEQSRAFEEISFQLLKSEVPAGTRAVRTGNPDGGVEWYVTLADGTEWGWQAKHVHGIDALLTAMTGSVERVAKERPGLRKLTFVISWNLATGKAAGSGRERKSQREKYKDKIAAWKKDIPGSLSKIEFKEVQSYSRPIGRGVRTERPPVIGMENSPGFEVSDRALDWRTQSIYLRIEFLLPVKQFPALRLLKRGDEARALIAFVADPTESSRHDIFGFCLRKGCHVVIMPGDGLGYE